MVSTVGVQAQMRLAQRQRGSEQAGAYGGTRGSQEAATLTSASPSGAGRSPLLNGRASLAGGRGLHP